MTEQNLTAYRQFREMTWPCPGERLDELGWTFRYGRPSRQDFMVAASVISAFQEIVRLPENRRREIVAELRRGANIHQKLPSD